MRKKSQVGVVIVAVVCTFAASVVVLAKPPPESGVVSRAPTDSGFVYSGDGVHVLTGPPLAQGCLDQGFGEPIAQHLARPNSTSALHFRSTEAIHVFDDEGIPNVFEWLGMACAALLDGNPDTLVPQPLATGTGTVTYVSRVDADGVEHVHNKVVGKVTTAEGARVHLSTFAAFNVDESGLTLTALRVNYGG